jgi:hypothetical protein
MRESAIFLKGDAVDHAIESNLITREESIVKFCSRSQTTQVKRGRKVKTEKVSKVPKKPRASPLLTQPEMEFLNYVSKGIFIEPSEEELRSWAQYITQFGFKKVKADLESNYNLRRQYLTGFSRITTARLTEFRKLKPEERYKKKKDIAPTDVQALLSSRENAPGKFAREVSFVDPQFQRILSVYRTVTSKEHGHPVLDVLGSLIKIEEDVRTSGVYSVSEGNPIAPPKEPQVVPKNLEKVSFKDTNQGKKIPEWENIGYSEIRITPPDEEPGYVSHSEDDVINEPDDDNRSITSNEKLTNTLEEELDKLKEKSLDYWMGNLASNFVDGVGSKPTLFNSDTIKACSTFIENELPTVKNYWVPSTGSWYLERNYSHVVQLFASELRKFKLSETRKAITEIRDLFINLDSSSIYLVKTVKE